MDVQISVITVTRNCAATVADCLASVAGQAWSHREHVVIDGASTDGTLALLVSEPDQGIYG